MNQQNKTKCENLLRESKREESISKQIEKILLIIEMILKSQ